MKAATGALALFFALAGCGYRWGFVRPEGVRTVAVQMFENETFRRGVELSLSEEIAKEVSERSGFVLESAERADALIRGKITQITDNLVLQGPSSQARSALVWINVRAELVDRKTGKSLRIITLQDRGQFVTDNQQDRDTAIAKAVQRLAQKIVFSLGSDSSQG